MAEKKIAWWHPKFNMLGTRKGRLTAFFLLYLTEGLPQGFALVAMVTQMRRLNVTPEMIGSFSAVIILPWAFKWAMGPVIDLFYYEHWGRRRLWIVGAQIMMCATLLAALPVDMASQIKLLSWLLVIHNIFAATQDVAIDALACGTLKEHERGIANGLMFSGAYTGSAIGGAGVLFLIDAGVSLNISFLFVVCCVFIITLLVSMRLREERVVEVEQIHEDRWRALGDAFLAYGKEAGMAFFGSGKAVAGLFLALLPLGAYSLSLALCSNLSVELGMSDGLIARLTLLGTLVTAPSCVLGGFLSDKFGRRKMLMLFVVGTVVPTLILAWGMHTQGWIFPVPMDMADRPEPTRFLFYLYVGVGLLYALFQGLIYGTKSAMFMDICHPSVAATQFTAYMALMNLVISYSTWWQCKLVSRLGYPVVLVLDVVFGMLCLGLIPFMSKHHDPLTMDAQVQATAEA